VRKRVPVRVSTFGNGVGSHALKKQGPTVRPSSGKVSHRPRVPNPDYIYVTVAGASLRRQHVLAELRFADHQNAGPRAWCIPSFERDRAGAGIARLDLGKPHRGLARNAEDRAVSIEHRCSPGSPWSPPRVHRLTKLRGSMCKIAHVSSYPR
jgi:hypothetical protein